MSLTIFNDIFSRVETVIDNYVSGTSANIVNLVDNYTHGLLVIFVALWGYSLQQGLISEPVGDGVRRIVKIALILTLALNSGTYGYVVVDFLQQAPEEVARAITGSPIDSTANPNILDELMNKGFEIGFTAYEKAGVINGHLSLFLVALIVWVSTVAITAYAAGLILFSKFATALLLAIGPIYIVLALFKSTQRFFESWLTQTVNYGTLLVITVATVELLFSVFEAQLNAVLGASIDKGVSIEDTLCILIMAVIVCFVLRQASSIASGISGGISLATQGAFSWAMGKLSSGASAMRPRNIAMSYDRTARHLKQDVAALQRPALAAKGLYMRVTGQNKNSVSNG